MTQPGKTSRRASWPRGAPGRSSETQLDLVDAHLVAFAAIDASRCRYNQPAENALALAPEARLRRLGRIVRSWQAADGDLLEPVNPASREDPAAVLDPRPCSVVRASGA